MKYICLFFLILFALTGCVTKSYIITRQSEVLSEDSIIKTAKKYIGSTQFDCSSFVQKVFIENGIKLPRTSEEQYRAGINAGTGLLPDDLLFFTTTTLTGKISHIGIYIGDNKFIHSGGHGVRIDSLEDKYYRIRYIGARRVKE
ncbi:MAG: C40 family peptidase [Candidatus Firestonebacteria bacterium]